MGWWHLVTWGSGPGGSPGVLCMECCAWRAVHGVLCMPVHGLLPSKAPPNLGQCPHGPVPTAPLPGGSSPMGCR